MFTVVIAAGLALDPWSLVRVDDPLYPGADARSQSGAVLLEPPAAVREGERRQRATSPAGSRSLASSQPQGKAES